MTTFPIDNGGKRIERGKYRDNILIKVDKVVTGARRIFDFRSSKLRDRIDDVLKQARKSADIAVQKAEVATAR